MESEVPMKMKGIAAFIVALGIAMSGWGQEDRQLAQSFGGRVLFYCWNGAAGLTQEQRMRVFDKRLIDILAYTHLGPRDVRIRVRPRCREIIVKNHLLVTVTPEDASAYGWSMDQVAAHWQESIRGQISAIHLLPQQV
jgi:hypothetical protein